LEGGQIEETTGSSNIDDRIANYPESNLINTPIIPSKECQICELINYTLQNFRYMEIFKVFIPCSWYKGNHQMNVPSIKSTALVLLVDFLLKSTTLVVPVDFLPKSTTLVVPVDFLSKSTTLVVPVDFLSKSTTLVFLVDLRSLSVAAFR
jgi:hypothetical protein